jgi:hypothetical protein
VTRAEFLDWLEGRLRAAGVPVRPWQVEPGLGDLEVRTPEGETVRLRIVRTGGGGGSRPDPSRAGAGEEGGDV